MKRIKSFILVILALCLVLTLLGCSKYSQEDIDELNSIINSQQKTIDELNINIGVLTEMISTLEEENELLKNELDLIKSSFMQEYQNELFGPESFEEYRNKAIGSN